MRSPLQVQPREVQPRWLLLILCTATFMGSLDLFIVNVGLRAIGHDVGVTSLASLSWVLNAYAIIFAALLVPAGRLADRYGNKPAFLFGLALFTASSIGCALSDDLWFIVAFRCLQAAGAAALTPTSLGLILTAIPAERRAHSIRLWAVSGSLGAAAGPALGGLLVQVSWRWIFLLNVPIGVTALVAAALLAPNVKHGTETRTPDLLGGALLIAANGALALGLVQGPGWGWTSGGTLTSFVVAMLATALFLTRSAGHPAPVVDLVLFGNATFRRANLVMLLISVPFGANLLGLVLWLQEGWHWSPLQTGLGISPGPVMVTVTALGLRRWTTRMRPGRVLAIGGLFFAAGGVAIGTSIGTTPNYLTGVLPGWLLVGVGVGLVMPTVVQAGTSVLSPHQTSTGSAVIQMARQIGSVLGVAGLVVILGTPASTAGLHDRFRTAMWLAGAVALVAAATALPLARHRPAPVTAKEQEADLSRT
jgi:EmrB/QacA subfamily drug resistance transporter